VAGLGKKIQIMFPGYHGRDKSLTEKGVARID
jgi:hypothetical protein